MLVLPIAYLWYIFNFNIKLHYAVVPLSTFLTFNRVKKLATTVEEIEKSLDNSELLELSCDRTRVRRSTDIVLKENVDEYTIYVVSNDLNFMSS